MWTLKGAGLVVPVCVVSMLQERDVVWEAFEFKELDYSLVLDINFCVTCNRSLHYVRMFGYNCYSVKSLEVAYQG